MDGDDGKDDGTMSVISSLSFDDDFYCEESAMCLKRTGAIYGRTKEVEVLLETFQRVRNGPSEVIAISGEAGSGKSQVVEAIRDPVTLEFNGYFVVGKFDQLRLDEPFSAIVNAFQDLTQFISLSEHVEQRREEIGAALGADAALLCNLIPGLSKLINIGPFEGQHDEVREERKNCFDKLTLACRKLLDAIATKENPLCFFLDDIQWADAASMLLIQTLISNVNSKHVLLVLAYRDSVPNVVKDIEEILNGFQNSGGMIPTTKMSICNIDVESINLLICNRLNMTNADESLALSECIWKKTLGNPFFVLEFLDELLARGFMIRIDTCWEIDIERIQNETDISTNVATVIYEKLQRLHVHVRTVLTFAAYIGFEFRCNVLEAIVVSEHNSSTPIFPRFEMADNGISGKISKDQYHKWVNGILHIAIAAGLIEKSDHAGTTMKFVHDYPQTILYNSIPKGTARSRIHMRIGRGMRENMLNGSSEIIFAIVHHLNHASLCMSTEWELVDLARLNLEAAELAVKKKFAFLNASEYLRCAIDLLDKETMWQSHYGLCLQLHSLSAETEYCLGNFERSQTMIECILVNGRTIEDKASAYYAEIDVLNAQAMPSQSIIKGISILRLLGEEIMQTNTKLDFERQITKIRGILRGKSDEVIISLPMLRNDAKILIITTILVKIMSAAFFAREEALFAFGVLRLVQLSMEEGLSSVSPPVFAGYALMESKLGNAECAYRFGMLSLNLMKKLSSPKSTCQTLTIVWSFVLYWKRPLIEASKQLREACAIGTDQGDMEYACLAAFSYIKFSYYCGGSLHELENDCRDMCEQMRTFKQEGALQLTLQYWWAILSLMGADSNYHYLLQQDGITDEAVLSKNSNLNNNKGIVVTCRLIKLVNSIYFGDLGTSEEMITKISEDQIYVNKPQLFLLMYKFHSGLAFYALAACSTLHKKSQYQQSAEKCRNDLLKLSKEGCPTATVFSALLNAEHTALVSRDASKVLKAYTHAVEITASNAFVNYEALSNERAYFALLDHGVNAPYFLECAIKCYMAWGADKKVEILRSKLPIGKQAA